RESGDGHAGVFRGRRARAGGGAGPGPPDPRRSADRGRPRLAAHAGRAAAAEGCRGAGAMSRPRLAAGRHPLPARRRQLLVAGAAAPLLLTLRPLYATPAAMAAAIAGFTGGVKPQEGKVTLEIAQLIDNGNTVPVRIRVDSPMTEAEHVTDIGLFNERNPLPDVVRFRLTPRLGKAEVATRIRLATSQ